MTQEFKGKKISILGIGRSGMAAAKTLKELGADVFLSDSKAADLLQKEIEALRGNGTAFETGGHSGRVLSADAIVISPGVPNDIPVLKQAREKRIAVIGEIELAYRIHPKGWVAVTGSNGKTTTTTLIGEMIAKGKQPSRLGGNIGIAATADLLNFPKQGIFVAELSSFQLETIETFRPEIAVVINLSPNHLDRYPDAEAYYNAKKRIAMNMKKSDWLIYNQDNEQLFAWAQELEDKIQLLPFSLRKLEGNGAWLEDGELCYRLKEKTVCLMKANETGIKGPHNTANQLAAVLAAKLKGIEDKQIIDALKNFKGIAHRLEFVRKRNGISYYNDSKATTVESVKVALESFQEPVHLIAGGYDKGSQFEFLNVLVREHCARVILIGKAADKMEKAWKEITTVVRAVDLSDAIQKATKDAKTGDVVLLSPACASFDMFKNFEERGELFKKLVLAL